MIRVSEVLERFGKDVTRLTREQLKMNTLLERNMAGWEKAIDEVTAERKEIAAQREWELAEAERKAKEDMARVLVPELLRFLDDLWEARRVMEKAADNAILADWTKALAALYRQGEYLLRHFAITLMFRPTPW